MRIGAVRSALLALALGVGTAACEGPAGVNGKDGTSGNCTVTSNPANGTATITCPDGTTTTVTSGTNGAPGTSCTVADNGDGTKTITCADGTKVTVRDGTDLAEEKPFRITNFHGQEYLGTTGPYALGAKVDVDVKIDSATADAAGVVTVSFHVANKAGKPVTNVAAITANINKLVPAAAGEASSRWVAYIYRTETVAGNTFPNPAGTVRYQANREGDGTLTNNHDGSYKYVFKNNLSSAKRGSEAISYERNLVHRVAIMMGGGSGPTGDAWFDFVPDGSSNPATRDLIQTDTCKACHGPAFAAHGRDRLSLQVCVTCHQPGTEDAQSGNTVDFKVMIHKIHAGGELPDTAGDDGVLWDDPTTAANEEADNHPYTIFGFQNNPATWWKADFPAVLSNCQKCHQGSGKDVDNWKQKPSRAVCGSCHDDVNFADGTNHAGGVQNSDSSCATCHPGSGAEGATIPKPVETMHDWTTRDPQIMPEFDVTRLEVTGATGGGGAYFQAGDVPVVHVKLVDAETGETIAVPYVEDDAAEGCTRKLDSETPECNEPRDGKFRSVSLFVSGPRGNRAPVLSTGARAQNSSASAGPWNIPATSFNNSAAVPAVSGKIGLTLKIDNGGDVHILDSAGGDVTALSLISVAMPDASRMPSYWPDPANTTAANLRDWLNATAAFRYRAIAWVDAKGVLWIRSRNLGRAFSVQFLSGELVKTDGSLPFKIAGNVSDIKSVNASTVANRLLKRIPPAADDPMLSWDVGASEALYTLDPVDDLQPGTYVVKLEITDRGNKGATNFKTPSVAKATFQVKTATEEKPPAANCNSCHQGPDGRGFVLDYLRHNKHFDFNAVDTCGSCHDYLPQNLTGTNTFWSGPVPISRRVHAVHNGAALSFPNGTVGHADEPVGRNWDITFPQDVRNCEACHPDGTTSGSWKTQPSRLPCMGCHDNEGALGHYSSMVYDPSPTDPWSGDEREACLACHEAEP